MIQTIPRGNFGGQLGETLGTGLNQLAGFKLAQLTKQYEQAQEKSNFTKAWEPILGKNTAQFLSNLAPEERQNVLGNFEQLQQLNPQSNQQSGLSALSGNRRNQELNQRQQDPRQQLQQALGQYFNNPTLGQQQGFEPEQVSNQSEFGQQEQGLSPERAKLVQQLFETPEQRKERKKSEIENQKIARADQLAADKETKKYFENALDLEKAADFSDIRLKKMENLIKKGGLPISGFYNLFKDLEEKVPAAYGAAAGGAAGAYAGGPVGAAIGSAIGGLLSPIGTMLRFAQKHTSPNTEEFEKLSNDFIKDAKAIFGSRITDRDLIAFMATVPTLGQTDAGKLAIINNMKMFNRASRIRAEEVKDVIRENGNRRPHNLQILVEDRIKPQLDRLSQEFSIV